MISTVDVGETTLPELIRSLATGDVVFITAGSSSVPIAKIEALPVVCASPKRLGALAHLNLQIPDNFFDPLPEEELRLWEGHSDQ